MKSICSRRSVIALLAAGAFSVSASAVAQAQTQLQLTEPDTLTVVAQIPFPLFMNGTPTDITGGLHYDLINTLAEDLGIPSVKFRTVEFAPLVAGSVPDYDIGIMEIFVNPKRQEVNDYTSCYRRAYNVAIVPKGTKVETLEDLRELKWGTQPGSGGQDIILNYINPLGGFQSYPSIAQHAKEALKAGFINAIIEGSGAAALFSDPEFAERFEIAAKVTTEEAPDGYCIAMQLPKGSPNLEAVNASLKKIMDAGKIQEWQEKYGIFAPPQDIPTLVLSRVR